MILVGGMMCEHCEARVKKALEGLEGIREAKADHTSGEVLIKGVKIPAEEQMKQAVEAQDYEYIGRKDKMNMQKTLQVEGMMCEHCEATVRRALEAVDGVSSARADHNSGTAVVTLTANVDDEVLKQAVEAKDYKVTGIA